MHLSENLTAGKLTATVQPATNYEAVNGVYANRIDPLARWLTLEAGPHTVHLRLTWEQLNALHAMLDALLTDHTRHVLGHNEPAEVLADRDPTAPDNVGAKGAGWREGDFDRDPTAPVEERSEQIAGNVWRINGNEVAFTATDDWKLTVKTVNGQPFSNRDLPDWDSYAEALAYLETILETRPATTRS